LGITKARIRHGLANAATLTQNPDRVCLTPLHQAGHGDTHIKRQRLDGAIAKSAGPGHHDMAELDVLGLGRNALAGDAQPLGQGEPHAIHPDTAESRDSADQPKAANAGAANAPCGQAARDAGATNPAIGDATGAANAAISAALAGAGAHHRKTERAEGPPADEVLHQSRSWTLSLAENT
jgi:hypothetical protein